MTGKRPARKNELRMARRPDPTVGAGARFHSEAPINPPDPGFEGGGNVPGRHLQDDQFGVAEVEDHRPRDWHAGAFPKHRARRTRGAKDLKGLRFHHDAEVDGGGGGGRR